MYSYDRRTAAAEDEVIESKHWKHKLTGATASLYGAVPWSGAKGDKKEDWELVSTGWTIRWADGTIGRMDGKPPFHSKGEGEAYLEKFHEKGLKGGWSHFTM
jgi:hypothetical protein